MTRYMYYPVYDAVMGARCTIWYYGIYTGVMCDIHVLYLFFFARCMSCPSSSTNYHTYTLPAISVKLIYF